MAKVWGYIVLIIAISLILYFYYMYKDYDGYMKISCSRIKSVMTKFGDKDIQVIVNEIENIYFVYSRNVPQFKSVYPDIVVWMEDIVYRVECDFLYTKKLQKYLVQLIQVRIILSNKYPFSNYSIIQQDILSDVKKLYASEDDIVVNSIILRIKDQFSRINIEEKRINRFNKLSFIITAVSVIVTIISLLKSEPPA